MAPPRYDPTINLGHILTIIVLLTSGVAAWTSVNSALATHETRIVALESYAIDGKQLPYRVQTVEAKSAAMERDIERGRAERLAFQNLTAETQQKILETLTQIREDLAALKAQAREPR